MDVKERRDGSGIPDCESSTIVFFWSVRIYLEGFSSNATNEACPYLGPRDLQPIVCMGFTEGNDNMKACECGDPDDATGVGWWSATRSVILSRLAQVLIEEIQDYDATEIEDCTEKIKKETQPEIETAGLLESAEQRLSLSSLDCIIPIALNSSLRGLACSTRVEQWEIGKLESSRGCRTNDRPWPGEEENGQKVGRSFR